MKSSHLGSILARYDETVKEKYIEEGRRIGLDEGVSLGEIKAREEEDIRIAHWMLNKNMSVEDIMELTGLSLDKINSLNGK